MIKKYRKLVVLRIKVRFELNTHLDAFGLFKMLNGLFVLLVAEFLDSKQMPGEWIFGVQLSGLFQVLQDFAIKFVDRTLRQFFNLQEMSNGDGIPLRVFSYIKFIVMTYHL